MPRNGQNVMSKPAGTTAVTGTPIESAPFNQLMDDIVADLNAARPITAGGTGATTKAGARNTLALGAADTPTFAGLTIDGELSVEDVAASGNISVDGDLTVIGEAIAPAFIGMFNAKYHGVVGDGVTDDSVAIQNALAFAINNNGKLDLPAGKFLLNSRVIQTVTGEERKFGICGQGDGVSEFIIPSTNVTGGIGINVEGTAGRRDQATFEHFSMETRAKGGIGLQMLQNAGGNQDLSTVRCRDVRLWTEVTGDNYFNIAFDFSGSWRAKVEGCVWSGPTFGNDHTDGDPSFDTQIALKLHDSYSPLVRNCIFKGAQVGIDSVDLRGGSESEGFTVLDCRINHVLNGVRINRSAQEPNMKVIGTHINYRNNGVLVDGARMLEIAGCVIFNEDDNSEYTGVPADIRLTNASYFNVHDNMFNSRSHADRVGIYVASDDISLGADGRWGLIKDNMFLNVDMDYGIYLEDDAIGIRGDNYFVPDAVFVTGALRDSAGNNVTMTAI